MVGRETSTLVTVNAPNDLGEYTLATAAVARRLGVSIPTVTRHARAGAIPHIVTPGGWRRFRPSDVETFAATLTPSTVVTTPVPAGAAVTGPGALEGPGSEFAAAADVAPTGVAAAACSAATGSSSPTGSAALSVVPARTADGPGSGAAAPDPFFDATGEIR